ncbi:MAG: hypothetical protein HY902_21340 [Deltaproteobacteria bacterium]|nr:hypothetical protein [Deltaproteobacteria bacterium]
MRTLVWVLVALAGLAACGNPGGAVAGSPDAAAADAEIAESPDVASVDADVGDGDVWVDVPGFQKDCAAPQTAGCPCSKPSDSCCFTPTWGLECHDFGGGGVWTESFDCCRDVSCSSFDPNHFPPWCNGKAPW